MAGLRVVVQQDRLLRLVTAVGLPAAYVPLPIGNGEQALNAAPVVAAGGPKDVLATAYHLLGIDPWQRNEDEHFVGSPRERVIKEYSRRLRGVGLILVLRRAVVHRRRGSRRESR